MAAADDRPVRRSEDAFRLVQVGGAKVSTTKISAINARRKLGPSTATVRLNGSLPMAGAADREDLLDRLARFRKIMPALAQELASARRQSAALRVENRKLLEEIRHLQRNRGESSHSSTKSRAAAAEALPPTQPRSTARPIQPTSPARL